MRDSKEIRVLSSIAQIDDLVASIGGERVKPWALVQGDLDPHSYELVKGDDEKFVRADLIFYNGLNLEHGASLSSILRSSSKATAVGDEIAKKYPEKILQKEGIIDPHLWMDVSLWSHAIDPILTKLCQMDPEGILYYRERALKLGEQMASKHRAIREKLQQIVPDKRYLLTTHDAFRYFARGYFADEGEADWQNRFAAPEGLAPDGQLGLSDIRDMITFLKKHRISVLFPESNLSRDSIQKIASSGREMGLDVRVCTDTLYGDSMSSLSYLEMMETNADVMKRHLQ